MNKSSAAWTGVPGSAQDIKGSQMSKQQFALEGEGGREERELLLNELWNSLLDNARFVSRKPV